MSSTSLRGPSGKGSSRHGRTKSGVPTDESPLLQGWIARESGVVEKLLNKRYAALYPTTFVTYRKDTDPSPSKVWPLTKDVSLSPVEGAAYNMRHRNTSTLWAVARGAYDTMQMWGFTIHWPHESYLGGSGSLTLAFDAREKADEWREAFQGAVDRLAAASSLRRSSSGGSFSSSIDYQEARSLGGEEGAAGAGPGLAGSAGSVTTQALGQQDIVGGRVASATAGGGGGRAGVTRAERQAQQQRAGGGEEAARKGRAWASVLHINGVAVYTEELDESGEGGAVMVSAVVRAPPADVFRNLVQLRKSEGLGVFAGARLVEALDANNAIVAQTWRGAGVAGGLSAPREVVLLRTWRKDDDGTYIVLYQSTKHRAVREEGGGRWSWYKPVRVQIQAAGFTIAPLMPQYSPEGGSQEALLTMVLKADMGGFLSESSVASKLLGPLRGLGLRGLLEPIVTSIVILRDKVEQDRFVVRPLSSLAGDDVWIAPEPGEAPAPLPGAPLTAAQAGAEAGRRAALKKRTATMLAYRKAPLLRAQQEKAEEAAESAALAKQALAPQAPAAGGVPPLQPEPSAVAAAVEQEAEAEAIRGTCDPRFWSCPGDAGFKVRGSHYLADKKKVPAAPPLFELVATDLLELEEPLYNICRYLPSVKHSPAPFLLSVQLMVPSTPPIALVTHFAAPFKIQGASPEQLIREWAEAEGGECPPSAAAGLRAFAEFVEGEGPEADKRRNSKFKLIPNIAKGSWIIRQSVGTTPVLLGHKLTTKYFRGPNYLEVDVDIGSSSVAASVTNLVCGATKSLVIDLGVLVEGQSPDTLPEQLLGTIRLDRLDLGTAGYLDEVTGKVIRGKDIRGK